MKIVLVTPASARSRSGNRVTALRWSRILKGLGHRVHIAQEYTEGHYDLLIALHARRSFRSIERFRLRCPDAPRIVALTGTDLYHDIRSDSSARRALEWASRLVLLQPLGIRTLPRALRSKASVIYQSVAVSNGTRRLTKVRRTFRVCVLAHLRPVKDPFRAAEAARLLPVSSRVQIIQLGAALTPDMARAARAMESSNPRYRWLGDVPRGRALRMLARSRLLALTSRMEGGANVISEALAASVPIVSSRIDGSIGLLGPDYPGLFPPGDTRALAKLFARAETDVRFYATLLNRCDALKPLIHPDRERQSWKKLLREVGSERMGYESFKSPKAMGSDYRRS